MLRITALAGLAAYISSVAAHGGVIGMSICSTSYPGWQPFNSPSGQSSAERPYSSFNPITVASDPTMSCNDDGNSSGGQLSININAGDTIVFHYSQWTHLPGPVTAYMAACPGSTCTGANSDSLTWFKIQEQGLISGTVYDGIWALKSLMDTLVWSTVIPTNLKPGPYLIRLELLAIHQANSPQWYPECVQLIVAGSGSAVAPASLSGKIPGLWSQSDPGVNIDIYSDAAKTQTTYPIPGPRVWDGFTFNGYNATCSGVVNPPPYSSAKPTSSTSSTKPASSSTSTTRPVSSSSSSSSGGGTGTAAHWAQCGGQGYTGPTTCASPYTCTYSNQYYSQCL